jgi:hypothetical protein
VLANLIWSEKGSKAALPEFNQELANALALAQAALERETRTSAPVDYLAEEPVIAPVEPDGVPKDYVVDPAMQKWLDSRWSLPFKYFKKFCETGFVKAVMQMHPNLPPPLRIMVILAQIGLVGMAFWALCTTGL